ncbi:MAG: Ig domain-containing protein [Candidatus Cryptobacteroides sp.]
MKKYITMALLLFSAVCILSCKKDSPSDSSAEEPSFKEKYWFHVNDDDYFAYYLTGKTLQGLKYVSNEMQADIYSASFGVPLDKGDAVIVLKIECKVTPVDETSGLILVKEEDEWTTAEYSELTDDSVKLKFPGNDETLLFRSAEALGLEIKNIVDIMEGREVTGISLNQTELVVLCGASATLKATVEPESAYEKGVIWSSDNEAVATVKDGIVTTHSAGTATITATTIDGGLTASCIFEVAPVIEKVQVRAKGRNYVSHFCQMLSATANDFEFVITPSDATFEYGEITMEVADKWTVTNKTATGFTVTQNDEEGYANEVNLRYFGKNVGYLDFKSLIGQDSAKDFFKSGIFQIYYDQIWYIDNGVAYCIYLMQDESKTYVVDMILEGYLDYKKSENQKEYYDIANMYDRKTRDENDDFRNLEFIIDYTDSQEKPDLWIWGNKYGIFPADMAFSDTEIQSYLNNYCD